ncbi:hypothetical protein LZK75_33435 (plasmid) [Rhizobium leguminosarum]|nr:hypothetical protein LZK75_33435 [Rhizobium leguminosarum]
MDRYLRVGSGCREGVACKAAPGKGEQQEKQEGHSSSPLLIEHTLPLNRSLSTFQKVTAPSRNAPALGAFP